MQHHVNGKTPGWLVEVRRANGDARPKLEELFLTAILVCDALPDRDLRFFHVSTAWPLCPRDEWFGYSIDPDDAPEERFTPSPHEVAIMLDVLALGRALDRRQWKIVTDRAAGFSWEAIGDRRHLPAEVVRWHYGRALDAVVDAAMCAERN